MQKRLLLLIFVGFLTGKIYGQSVVKGTVNNENGKALPDVEVSTEDGQNFTFTDEKGTYSLVLEKGTYSLTFKGVKGNTAVKLLTIENSKEYQLDVTLKENQKGGPENIDEVQIVGRRIMKGSQAESLLLQKKAVMLKESVSAQELSQKGVSNAAGAVSKIVGVSKQESTGNVYVRGLGDRYLNTTINGLTLPSNEIDKKNIDLNLFSTGIINNISISKSYSSQFYGDFSAGNINITSKEYTGKHWLIQPSVDFSTNSMTINRANEFVQPEGTGIFGFYNRYDHNPFAVVLSHGVDPVSARGLAPVNLGSSLSIGKTFDFGNNSRLGFFLTGSFKSDYEYREGPAADYGSVLKTEFPNTKQYIYNATTTTLANLTYTINKNHKLSYNSLFINDAVNRVGYYGFKGKGTNRDVTGEGYYTHNIQFNQNLIFVNQLIGSHRFENGKFKVDWAVGLNNVYSHEPDRKRFSFLNYQTLFDDDPDTNPLFIRQNNFVNQRYFQNIKDREWSSRINMAYKPSEHITLDIGYDAKQKKRSFNNITIGYPGLDIKSDDFVVDPNRLNPIFNMKNVFSGKISTIVIRPIPIDPEKGLYLPTKNYPGLPESMYNASQSVQAVYVSPKIRLGEKWLIVPGIRIEAFNQQINWNVQNIEVSQSNQKGTMRIYQTLYLPGLNIRYALTKADNLRFAASRTVSFPEFKEVAPFLYQDVTQSVEGNPDLLGRHAGSGLNYENVGDKPYSNIYNFDLKYEHFFGKTDIISLAVFYKTIEDPINRVVTTSATGSQSYFRTGDKATAYGLELQARKQILKDDKGNSLAGIGFNASYIKTKQDLYHSIAGSFQTSFDRKSDELQGASPFVMNLNLNFNAFRNKNFKSSLNLVSNFFSDRIYSLGSGKIGNRIEKGYATLNLIWKNILYKNWSINLFAKNIFNQQIAVLQEVKNAPDAVIFRYRRGVDMGLQIKYRF